MIMFYKKKVGVIFSDEKKFNLDGSDGWNYYFHDLKKEGQYLSLRRQMGGRSVMVCGPELDIREKLNINFLSDRINIEKYPKIIRRILHKGEYKSKVVQHQ